MRKGNVKTAGSISYLTKTTVLLAAIISVAAAHAQSGASTGAPAGFLPKHLAVLRAGDGAVSLHLKQSPVFVDEFATDGFSGAPIMSVAIPTNGPDAMFFNGHAATEGMMSLSSDGKLLTFAGYGGVNLLQQPGTPSLLDIGRALCAVDASGKSQTIIFEEYNGTNKMNPRGAVSDGANHFWTCGNVTGTAYYDAGTKTFTPFTAIPDSRQVKIISGTLYTTLNAADAMYLNTSPGIYSFVDGDGNAVLLPTAGNTTLKLEVPADKSCGKIVGFDMNTAGTIAYTADVDMGVEKYVKTNGAWKFAGNFKIPQTIPESDNHEDGCFGLTVDFSGANPVIYATTTEGWGGSVNSNRVVQIVDTGASPKVITLAQASSTEIAYRGIAFTPEGK